MQGSDGSFYGTTRSGGSSGYGTVFKISTNGTVTQLVSFDGENGEAPEAGLTWGSDGNFYGTTYGGGSNGMGTVFQVTPGGTLTSLLSFNGDDGAHPRAALTLGPDGSFFGTTSEVLGGQPGTVFKVTTNGTLTTLLSFDGANGGNPLATMILGKDGLLYGTTAEGGTEYYGTVFKLTTNGTLTTLVSFNLANGATPWAALTPGNDGSFYGTTASGGTHGYGTVFKVTTNGNLTTLWSFDFAGDRGRNPRAALAMAKDGNFYGTTYEGGNSGFGTVFRMAPNGALTAIVAFNLDNGFDPSGLMLGTDGHFYGSTTGGGNAGNGTVFRVTTNGTFTTLSTFQNANGSNPSAELTLGSDGNLYGTTEYGGSSGDGTAFRLTTNGVLTTLASFDYTSVGARPAAALTQGNDHNFYGTTYTSENPTEGYIFRLTTNGNLTAIVPSPSRTAAALTLGNDGLFYGTTSYGGSSGYGAVFRVTTNGVLSTLASFNQVNGAYPMGHLTPGNDGYFYGTTEQGGSSGYGTVFSVTMSGAMNTLVSFAPPNGLMPRAGLALGEDGHFYGTTYQGGSNSQGTVFRVATNGTLTTLVALNSNTGDNPSGLMRGPDGNFYGTTPYSGGGGSYGTVFQVTTAGLMSSIVTFSGPDGASPEATLTLGSDGHYYGTTYGGGSDDLGTIFRLKALAPLIVNQPQPASQIVPAGVNVLIVAGVFGAVPQSHQWTFNTTNLPGQTNLTLSLQNASLMMSGNYALRVTNNLGFVESSNAVLTVLPAVVSTLPVSGISAAGAGLRGSVVIGPNETRAWFEWGTDTNYGQIHGVTNLPGVEASVTLSNLLGGLDGNLVYHYRIVASNSFGLVYGADESFQVGLKPTVVTLGASGATTTSVALNASINPGGRQTTAWFQWGPTTNYGNVTPATSVGSGGVALIFTNPITGYSVNTPNHCRVLASNSLGLVTGANVTFLIGAPLAVTETPTLTSRSNAWFNGRVTANSLLTTTWFEWGTDTNYGNSVVVGEFGNGSTPTLVSTPLPPLETNVTYHYRLVASNALGIAYGANVHFNSALFDYAESVLADQPVLYYRFDEVSGTTALNFGSMGGAGNGTYNAMVALGNPSLLPTFGLAAGFNNSNSSVAVPALGTNNQVTIEFWAKPRSFGVTSFGNPHTVANSIYTADAWVPGALHTHFVNNGPSFHQYEFAINGNSPSGFDVANSGVFPSNTWVHLAATYDVATRRLITHLNGRPVFTNTFSFARPVNLAAAHIGAWVGPGSTPNWFDGAIDEFAIYGTALPASRIQAHYQTAIGNPVLLATQATNRLTFSWAGPGFRLESNTNLANATGWTNVPAGSNSPVSVTISNSGNRFFRLKWP